MRRHLALILFLLTIAFPAMAMPLSGGAGTTAACHEAKMAGGQADMKGHRGDQQRQDVMGDHGCIGCVTNIAALPITIALMLVPSIQVQTILSSLTGTIPVPETPPPRI